MVLLLSRGSLYPVLDTILSTPDLRVPGNIRSNRSTAKGDLKLDLAFDCLNYPPISHHRPHVPGKNIGDPRAVIMSP